MLRATLDVNGDVIGVIAARRTMQATSDGAYRYRFCRHLLDDGRWEVGAVFHHPDDGAFALVATTTRADAVPVTGEAEAVAFINAEPSRRKDPA